jgi:hypothetical protein
VLIHYTIELFYYWPLIVKYFCTPWKIRTFICGFGDRYATIAPKRCLLVMRDSNLPPSRYQRDALTKWANYQYCRVRRTRTFTMSCSQSKRPSHWPITLYCYPSWIRTNPNSVKGSCATDTPSGNLWANSRNRTYISYLEGRSNDHYTIFAYQRTYEGNDGFEPPATWLTVKSSTAELIPQNKKPPNFWLEGLYNLNVIYILSYIRIL